MIIKDEDPGFDWEGHLHFECFLCAQQLTEAAKDKGPRKPMFSSDIVRNLKRASENAWSQRKTAMEGHSRRARAKGWKDFLEQLEIDHPGESRTQLRTRIIQAADELSRSISDAFLALSKEKREKYREVFLKWQDRYDKGKVDREYFPQFDESSVDALLADQLNTLIEGLDMNYWCRMPNCGFMTLNSCWIVKRRSTDSKPLDYSCPACLQRYRPWSTAKGQRQGSSASCCTGTTGPPTRPKRTTREWPACGSASGPTPPRTQHKLTPCHQAG